MNLIRQSPYRPSALISRSPQQRHRPSTAAPDGGDRVTLSSAAQQSSKGTGKTMAILGAIGTAVGIAAATVLFPAAGVGALLVSGIVGGVAGAAIGDGALETAGTKPAKPFDPYKVSDLLDPDNMFHPRNPNNPLNFPR